MPSGITDEWRARARQFTEAWYGRHIDAPIFAGRCEGEWSKGAAVADAVNAAGRSASVYVLADADSVLHNPDDLKTAIARVVEGKAKWAVPHRRVYRLNAKESRRLADDPTATARLGWTCRPMYYAVPGGGVTVVSREAFEAVGGIDARFVGWGGEDLVFGWALDTLVGERWDGDGQLVHLWHPHPAPNLRGSPASEDLVASYRSARGVRRRMQAVVDGDRWWPAEPLPALVRFRMTANRDTIRLASGEVVRFKQGTFETADPDVAEQLRTYQIVREEALR